MTPSSCILANALILLSAISGERTFFFLPPFHFWSELVRGASAFLRARSTAHSFSRSSVVTGTGPSDIAGGGTTGEAIRAGCSSSSAVAAGCCDKVSLKSTAISRASSLTAPLSSASD